jgi:TDG/mug DNA glycosylase family protein
MVLKDLLADGLRLVVCGSAAGARSAALGQYYAGPSNAFWRTLAATGLTPRLLAPSEFRGLLEFGIGLTDVVKDQSGADAAVDFRRADRAGLRAKIERHRPAFVCFNGKRAAETFFGKRVGYGLQDASIATTRLFVAPSTSGAARGAWDCASWAELAALVKSVEISR